jgi:hypothetical protein
MRCGFPAGRRSGGGRGYARYVLRRCPRFDFEQLGRPSALERFRVAVDCRQLARCDAHLQTAGRHEF